MFCGKKSIEPKEFISVRGEAISELLESWILASDEQPMKSALRIGSGSSLDPFDSAIWNSLIGTPMFRFHFSKENLI